MLRNEEFLKYSFSTYKWEWGDVEKLKTGAFVSDNVADIVAATLKSLDEATHITLKVASCLGKVIPLDILVEYFAVSFDEDQAGDTCSPALREIKTIDLTDILARAVKAGILIQPRGEDLFMWSHDKLQHVAYSLIPEDKRSCLHMKLGRILWKMCQLNTNEEWMVFMAADQVRRYTKLREDDALGAEVARLCYEAAKLSVSKSALYPAFDMLNAGTRHLHTAERWKTNYKLSLSMFSLLAQVAIQIGEFKDAMAAVDEVEQNASSLEDKFIVQAVTLKCITSGKDRNYALGVQKCLEFLNLYGEKMPRRLMPGQLFIENQKLKSRLPRHRIEGLLELPNMVDIKSLRTCRFLTFLCTFMMLSHGYLDLGCFASYRILNISCLSGLCEESASALVSVANYLLFHNRLKDATKYAEIAIKVIERFPNKFGSMHASVRLQAVAGIYSATQLLHSLLDQWLTAHHMALKIGDTDKAGVAIVGYAFTYINVGLPLGPLQSDLESYEQEARLLNVRYAAQLAFKIIRQTILNLEGSCTSPTVLRGAVMDQSDELSKLEGDGWKMTKREIDTFRLLLACVYNEWDEAKKILDDFELAPGEGLVPRIHLRRSWMGLAAFALGRLSGEKKYRKKGKSILELLKGQLKNGYVNGHPIYTMLEAENAPSKERYDRAIKTCARVGFIHFEAYICERAGLYFLERDDKGWGEFYLAQALVLYGDWGASGKVNRMKADHPNLLKNSSVRETAASALKGRTRYSSKYMDQLKEVSWLSLMPITN